MATLDISEVRVNNALKAFQTYGAGLGVRNQVTLVYPGGSYVTDLITFTKSSGETFTVQTNLAVIAPGITLNLLSQKEFIVPALAPVDTALVIPGINDFGMITTAVSKPPPVVVNFIGAEIIPGSGRHYALSSPLDHFVDGGLCFQNGKVYRKTVTPWPFGVFQEWDEITVVGN